MKLKILIVSLIVMLIVGGCGLFDLINWIMPDDIDFITLVENLNTPEKICDYMKKFDWNISIHTYSPLEMYLANLEDWDDTGDCDDFATFAIFVANWHGIETYRISLWVKYTGLYGLPLVMPHVLGVFVEDNLYTYSDNSYYVPLFTDNFEDILVSFKTCNPVVREVISWKVYDYKNNLIEVGN